MPANNVSLIACFMDVLPYEIYDSGVSPDLIAGFARWSLPGRAVCLARSTSVRQLRRLQAGRIIASHRAIGKPRIRWEARGERNHETVDRNRVAQRRSDREARRH